MDKLSSLSSNAFDVFGAFYDFLEPFISLAKGLSDLLGLIA